MLRVTHLISGLGTGGAEHLVVNLSAELRRLGVDSSITTLSDARGVPWQRAHDLGVPVVELGSNRSDPRHAQRVITVFRNHSLVHVHLFPSLYWAALASIRSRTPWVYTEHSTSNRRRGLRLLTPLERFAYKRPAELLAISPGVRDELAAHLFGLGVDRTISVVPNGIAPAFFHAGHPRIATGDTIRVIAVGKLDSRKNFALAIRTIARLPDSHLTIVGSGPQLGELRQLAAELGASHRVDFVPATDNVRELLDSNDVLLSTSRIEGFGLVAAEAMARGLPVVAPRIPGIRDVVEDGQSGLLFDLQKCAASDASQLISSLHQDDNLYRNISSRAVTRARTFSIENAAALNLYHYRSILADKRGGDHR